MKLFNFFKESYCVSHRQALHTSWGLDQLPIRDGKLGFLNSKIMSYAPRGASPREKNIWEADLAKSGHKSNFVNKNYQAQAIIFWTSSNRQRVATDHIVRFHHQSHQWPFSVLFVRYLHTQEFTIAGFSSVPLNASNSLPCLFQST